MNNIFKAKNQNLSNHLYICIDFQYDFSILLLVLVFYNQKFYLSLILRQHTLHLNHIY